LPLGVKHMGKWKFIGFFIILLLSQLSVFAATVDESEDLKVFGLEVEKLLAFGSAHLAAALTLITFLAYIRTKRSKLILITLAFFLFSIKLFMISSELFIDELPLLGPISAFLDFVILLSFFYGVIKK
jgi:hypothetical protein